MLPYLALIIVFAGVALIGALVLLMLLKKELERNFLNRKSAQLRNKIQDFERRLAIIEMHAFNYMNALGSGGTKTIYECRQLIISANHLLEEVESLIATNDFNAFSEARLLLQNKFPVTQQSKANFDGTSSAKYPSNPAWEERIEDLLQTIGYEISVASMAAARTAKQSGVYKRVKGKDTLSSLLEAGIRAVIKYQRQKSAPVRSMLRKNNSLR